MEKVIVTVKPPTVKDAFIKTHKPIPFFSTEGEEQEQAQEEEEFRILLLFL